MLLRYRTTAGKLARARMSRQQRHNHRSHQQRKPRQSSIALCYLGWKGFVESRILIEVYSLYS